MDEALGDLWSREYNEWWLDDYKRVFPFLEMKCSKVLMMLNGLMPIHGMIFMCVIMFMEIKGF